MRTEAGGRIAGLVLLGAALACPMAAISGGAEPPAPPAAAAPLAAPAAPSSAPSRPAPRPRTPQAVAAACEPEAVRLAAPLTLKAEPRDDAADLARLPPGASIYLCGEDRGFRAIRFPRPGEPVDCSYRSGASACPLGWVRELPDYEISG